MNRVLIIGAGGHGQWVASILQRTPTASSDARAVGFVDDDPTLVGRNFLGLPVLGQVLGIDHIPHDQLVIGIGANHPRSRLFEWAAKRDEDFANAIHASAVIDMDVHLGIGLVVGACCVLATESSVGDNVVMSSHSVVGHNCTVGSHAHLGPGSILAGGVTIGAGAMVGMGTMVLPGRTIGEWAVVGAGSIVTKDIPAYCTAVGSPARVIKRNGPQGEE